MIRENLRGERTSEVNKIGRKDENRASFQIAKLNNANDRFDLFEGTFSILRVPAPLFLF